MSCQSPSPLKLKKWGSNRPYFTAFSARFVFKLSCFSVQFVVIQFNSLTARLHGTVGQAME